MIVYVFSFEDSAGLVVQHQLRLSVPIPSEALEAHQQLSYCRLIGLTADGVPVEFTPLRAEPGGNHAVRLFMTFEKGRLGLRHKQRRFYRLAIPSPTQEVEAWARSYPFSFPPQSVENWMDVVFPLLRTPANEPLSSVFSLKISIKPRTPGARFIP